MDKSKYNENPRAYADINKAAYKLTLQYGGAGWSWGDLEKASNWSKTSCRKYYDEDFMPIPDNLKWANKNNPSIEQIYKELNNELNGTSKEIPYNPININYIYEIYHIDRKHNPNKHYVGRTNDIIRRMNKEHFNPDYWTKSPSKLLYWNLRQDGIENYAYRILEICYDEYTAKQREEYWINELHTMAIDGGFNERHEINN